MFPGMIPPPEQRELPEQPEESEQSEEPQELEQPEQPVWYLKDRCCLVQILE